MFINGTYAGEATSALNWCIYKSDLRTHLCDYAAKQKPHISGARTIYGTEAAFHSEKLQLQRLATKLSDKT